MKIRNTLITLTLGFFLSTIANAQVQPYFGGVGIGSLVPEGLHVSAVYLPIMGNQLNDANGNAISSIDLGMGAIPTAFDLNVNAFALNCMYVSDFKILGATYSAGAILPYAATHNVSFIATAPDGSEIPLINQSTPGLYDLVISPIQLGWSQKQWDITAGFGVNLPIGNFEAGAANRWSFMPNVGGTYYFDSKKTFSASTKVTFELNGIQQQEGLDQAYGDEMIVEWGLGKMQIPYGRFGIIGYSVFQLNEDKGVDATSTDLHSSHSIGGEYMMFIPPINLGVMLRGVTAISAKDSAPISLFMVGITKTFASPIASNK